MTDNGETAPPESSMSMCSDPDCPDWEFPHDPHWRFDEEFGITLDPCEHPSINGTTCAACGQEVPDGS